MLGTMGIGFQNHLRGHHVGCLWIITYIWSIRQLLYKMESEFVSAHLHKRILFAAVILLPQTERCAQHKHIAASGKYISITQMLCHLY